MRKCRRVSVNSLAKAATALRSLRFTRGVCHTQAVGNNLIQWFPHVHSSNLSPLHTRTCAGHRYRSLKYKANIRKWRPPRSTLGQGCLFATLLSNAPEIEDFTPWPQVVLLWICREMRRLYSDMRGFLALPANQGQHSAVTPCLAAEEPQVIQIASGGNHHVSPTVRAQTRVPTTEDVQPISGGGPDGGVVSPWGRQGAARRDLLPGVALQGGAKAIGTSCVVAF